MTATCAKGDVKWTFEGGYTITNNKSKGYATGSNNGIKYSSGVDFTVKLPEGVQIASVEMTGYDNYADGDSYIASLNGKTYSATDYVFPRKDSNGSAVMATHKIDFETPASGSFGLRFGGKQVVVSMILTPAKANGVDEVQIVPMPEYVDVYSMGGQLLRKAVYYKRALHGLPSGMYVVGGRTLYWYSR